MSQKIVLLRFLVKNFQNFSPKNAKVRFLAHPIIHFLTNFCSNIENLGGFAELEQNLLSFAYKTVLNSGFVPITVPDIVRRSTTEACGVEQRENQHAIQYILSDEQNLCLSGTAGRFHR